MALLQQSSRRLERLLQDLRGLEALARTSPIVSVTPLQDEELPTAYDVTLHLRGVSRLAADDLPRYATRFVLRVVLPPGYPFVEAPVCHLGPGSSPVFHPHFTPRGSFLRAGGRWVDYRDHDPPEGVASLVLRIAHSLRYDPGYVGTRAERAANPAAHAWFVRWKDAPQPLFPTDHAPLPQPGEFLPPAAAPALRPREPAKTFVIQGGDAAGAARSAAGAPKRFQVEEGPAADVPGGSATPAFELVEALASAYAGPVRATHEVYVRHPAMSRVLADAGWQGAAAEGAHGLLLGRWYVDTDRGVSWALVEHAVPGDAAAGAEIDWTAVWEGALPVLRAHPGVERLGWYHTGPDALPMGAEAADRTTQQHVFGGRLRCAVVLDPQRHAWRVFAGERLQECPGFVVRDASAAGGRQVGPVPGVEGGPPRLLPRAREGGGSAFARLASRLRAAAGRLTRGSLVRLG